MSNKSDKGKNRNNNNNPKKRGKNFSYDEMLLLVRLVEVNPSALLKRKRGATLNRKDAGWDEIVKKFNVSHVKNEPRTKKQLQDCFRRMMTNAQNYPEVAFIQKIMKTDPVLYFHTFEKYAVLYADNGNITKVFPRDISTCGELAERFSKRHYYGPTGIRWVYEDTTADFTGRESEPDGKCIDLFYDDTGMEQSYELKAFTGYFTLYDEADNFQLLTCEYINDKPRLDNPRRGSWNYGLPLDSYHMGHLASRGNHSDSVDQGTNLILQKTNPAWNQLETCILKLVNIFDTVMILIKLRPKIHGASKTNKDITIKEPQTLIKMIRFDRFITGKRGVKSNIRHVWLAFCMPNDWTNENHLCPGTLTGISAFTSDRVHVIFQYRYVIRPLDSVSSSKKKGKDFNASSIFQYKFMKHLNAEFSKRNIEDADAFITYKNNVQDIGGEEWTDLFTFQVDNIPYEVLKSEHSQQT